MPSSILVIKHGALGDMIQATGAFDAIRSYHAEENLTLLTSPVFQELAQEMKVFDAIIMDARLPLRCISPHKRLLKTLISTSWSHIYDLQHSTRSEIYGRILKLFQPYARWIRRPSRRHNESAFQRLCRQLQSAGLSSIPSPHVQWLSSATITTPSNPYVVLAIGASRPEKRWPPEHFATLAHHLHQAKKHVVLLGSPTEIPLGNAIKTQAPFVENLVGQTSLVDMISLQKKALGTIGHDSGPLHVAAACQTPCLVMFFRGTSPAQSSPVGPHVRILHHPADPHTLSPDTVWRAWTPFLTLC